MSKKLEQVLEYLIAGKQDKAKELLHQVFIEKARKIHEDIMSYDDTDEDRAIGGDEDEDWKHDIMGGHDEHMEDLSDEIDAEETMSEEEEVGDDMIDMHDDMDDDNAEMPDDDLEGDESDLDSDGIDDADLDSEDSEHNGMEGVEDSIGDLEDALAELKAEFERLESGENDVDDEVSDDETEVDDEVTDDETEVDDKVTDDETEVDDEETDDEMDESWLEEDWDDLAEAIELEKVKVPASGEVGSGKFSSDTGDKAKSPIAASQTQRMGAKPIVVDSKKHSGYNKETAPTSKEFGLSNRRKTAETGMSKVSKEGNSAAALNKTVSEFGINKDALSPLSKSPRK